MAADARPQIVFIDGSVFRRFKHAFKQYDGIGNAVLAQFDGLVHGGDGKPVGKVGQCVGAPYRAVSVSVRFNDGKHFAAVNLFQGLIIVAQIVQADSGIERAHGDSFFDKRKAAFQTAFNNI